MTHLKYLVVKKAPSNEKTFRKRVKRICENSPLECISLLWKNIDRNHERPIHFDMSAIKKAFKCPDSHPSIINIYDTYHMPFEFRNIIDLQSLILSDFKPKNIRSSTAQILRRQENEEAHFNVCENSKHRASSDCSRMQNINENKQQQKRKNRNSVQRHLSALGK